MSIETEGGLYVFGDFCSQVSMFLRNQVMNLSTIPSVADAVGRDLVDKIEIPD